MAIKLTQTGEKVLDNKNVPTYFKIEVGGMEIKDVINYNWIYNRVFGAASLIVNLTNENGKYSPNNSPGWGYGSEIKLEEGLYTSAGLEKFSKFTGIIRQISPSSRGEDVLSITAFDWIIKLEDLEIEKKFEADKTEVRDEEPTPNYLPAPNNNMAQVFDCAYKNIAAHPLPSIIIKDKRLGKEEPLWEGYEVNYKEGQIILGAPLNLDDYYFLVSYFYYPSGSYVEDIIEQMIVLPDGYNNSPFTVADNLTEDFVNVEGNNKDYMTPNYVTETIEGVEYPAGKLWYLTYNNLTEDLNLNDFTIPGANPISLNKRYGRLILDQAIPLSSIVYYEGNYTFKTIQATGIEVPYISFTSQKTANRFEALNQIRALVAPNYIIRTRGTKKIWGSYLNQKYKQDYDLKLIAGLDYAQDQDIYTRAKLFGENLNPHNLMLDEGVRFVNMGQTYKGFAYRQELTPKSAEGDAFGGAGWDVEYEDKKHYEWTDFQHWDRGTNIHLNIDDAQQGPNCLAANHEGEFTPVGGVSADSPNICFPKTVLGENIDENETTIGTQTIKWFEEPGKIKIDNEIIKYTNTASGHFWNCERGVDGTTAASHSKGAIVRPADMAESTRFKIEFWACNILGQGNAYIDWREFGEHDEVTQDGQNIYIPRTNHPPDYRHIQAEFSLLTDLNPNTRYIKLRFVTDGNPRGSAWLDKIHVTLRGFKRGEGDTWWKDGWTVYRTGLNDFGKILNNPHPVVYVNNYPIDNKVYPVVSAPVMVDTRIEREFDSAGGVSPGDVTQTVKYGYVVRLSHSDILPSEPIHIYDDTGRLVQIVPPHSTNFDYEMGAWKFEASDIPKPIIETYSTASYYINYSANKLEIDYENCLFRINNSLLSSAREDVVSADFPYQSVIPSVGGIGNICDGRWSTQSQVVFYGQPVKGLHFAVIDLGSIQKIDTIDMTAGFYKPREDAPDYVRRYDLKNFYTLQYSLDNSSYYPVCREAENFGLSGGSSISFEQDQIPEDFEARYIKIVLESCEKVEFRDGRWPVVISEFAVYKDMVLKGETKLVASEEEEDDTHLYDRRGLLSSVGDKLYKDTTINPLLCTQERIDKRAMGLLREFQKNHTKASVNTVYSPHLELGQTVKVVDTINNVSQNYFIEGISNQGGNLNLVLAYYPGG